MRLVSAVLVRETNGHSENGRLLEAAQTQWIVTRSSSDVSAPYLEGESRSQGYDSWTRALVNAAKIVGLDRLSKSFAFPNFVDSMLHPICNPNPADYMLLSNNFLFTDVPHHVLLRSALGGCTRDRTCWG
ncbi:unnamed protein product [Ectocarpus sp. 12 AP-2014]